MRNTGVLAQALLLFQGLATSTTAMWLAREGETQQLEDDPTGSPFGLHFIYVAGQWHGGTGVVWDAIAANLGAGRCTCPGPEHEAQYCAKEALHRTQAGKLNKSTTLWADGVELLTALGHFCDEHQESGLVVLKNPMIGTASARASSWGQWEGEQSAQMQSGWDVSSVSEWVRLLGRQRTTVVNVIRHPYFFCPFGYGNNKWCSTHGGGDICLMLWAHALWLFLTDVTATPICVLRFEGMCTARTAPLTLHPTS
jgi:hypothetical protein